jgi:hypothetical protein
MVQFLCFLQILRVRLNETRSSIKEISFDIKIGKQMKYISNEQLNELINLANESKAATKRDHALLRGSEGCDSQPTEQQRKLISFLKSMNKEQLCEVKALMWLGRGDGSSLESNYSHAINIHDEYAVNYIAEKVDSLGMYLMKGIEKSI